MTHSAHQTWHRSGSSQRPHTESVYRLALYRACTGRDAVPTYPDGLPTVSAATFAAVSWHDEGHQRPIAQWYGRTCDPVARFVARMLIEPDLAGQLAAHELLPLLRWCRLHTDADTVCVLVPTHTPPNGEGSPRAG